MEKAGLIGQYVVILDHHRDTIGGVLESYDPGTKTAVLSQARILWSYVVETGDGIGGLAVHGPLPGSRVGVVIERAVQEDCCRVLLCSDAARARWESVAWG